MGRRKKEFTIDISSLRCRWSREIGNELYESKAQKKRLDLAVIGAEVSLRTMKRSI